jgi:hypothetical protein
VGRSNDNERALGEAFVFPLAFAFTPALDLTFPVALDGDGEMEDDTHFRSLRAAGMVEICNRFLIRKSRSMRDSLQIHGSTHAISVKVGTA